MRKSGDKPLDLDDLVVLPYMLNPVWTWLTHLASRWGSGAVQMVAFAGAVLETLKWRCHRYPLQTKENKWTFQSDSCVRSINFSNPLGSPWFHNKCMARSWMSVGKNVEEKQARANLHKVSAYDVPMQPCSFTPHPMGSRAIREEHHQPIRWHLRGRCQEHSRHAMWDPQGFGGWFSPIGMARHVAKKWLMMPNIMPKPFE